MKPRQVMQAMTGQPLKLQVKRAKLRRILGWCGSHHCAFDPLAAALRK